MKQEDYCSNKCPYLKKLSQPGKLPFFCDLFKCFLATKKENVMRAELCVGKHFGTKESGYQLISSYQNKSINKQMTKWGFHRLEPALQSQFVSLVHQVGNEIGVEKNMPFKQRLIEATLIGQIKMANTELETSTPNVPDEFKTKVDKLSDDFPVLLNDANKNLLLNLYAVLDKSEQELLGNILSNPNKVEAFLKAFDDMPKGDNLVKDLRRELSEIEQQMQEEQLKQRNALLLHQQRLNLSR